jgi:hypothetical protein
MRRSRSPEIQTYLKYYIGRTYVVMEKLLGRPLSEVMNTLDATALRCIKAQLCGYLKQRDRAGRQLASSTEMYMTDHLGQWADCCQANSRAGI